MCLDLRAIPTYQGHISELIVASQSTESRVDIFPEVFPLKAKFFFHFSMINDVIDRNKMSNLCISLFVTKAIALCKVFVCQKFFVTRAISRMRPMPSVI